MAPNHLPFFFEPLYGFAQSFILFAEKEGDNSRVGSFGIESLSRYPIAIVGRVSTSFVWSDHEWAEEKEAAGKEFELQTVSTQLIERNGVGFAPVTLFLLSPSQKILAFFIGLWCSVVAILALNHPKANYDSEA